MLDRVDHLFSRAMLGTKVGFHSRARAAGQVLKPRPTGTVWKRGGTANTRWELTANHVRRWPPPFARLKRWHAGG